MPSGSNLPTYPNGYADPEQQPLYPQTKAELMGGRIPVSDSEAVMPGSLRQAVVGAEHGGRDSLAELVGYSAAACVSPRYVAYIWQYR